MVKMKAFDYMYVNQKREWLLKRFSYEQSQIMRLYAYVLRVKSEDQEMERELMYPFMQRS